MKSQQLKNENFAKSADLYRRDKNFDKMWRRWDALTCLLTISGFATATVDYEITYEYNKGDIQP